MRPGPGHRLISHKGPLVTWALWLLPAPLPRRGWSRGGGAEAGVRIQHKSCGAEVSTWAIFTVGTSVLSGNLQAETTPFLKTVPWDFFSFFFLGCPGACGVPGARDRIPSVEKQDCLIQQENLLPPCRLNVGTLQATPLGGLPPKINVGSSVKRHAGQGSFVL